MEDVTTEISIVTLNCWGLKYVSKLRRERLSEIGRQLAIADPQPHIVALQECWTQEDYRSIRRETRFILPYGKFYHSGAFGGGLAILSRWPIEESTMFRYPLNGRPTAFFRGDWYVGKGVACAKIRYGPGPKQVIEVFNTHTHAPYESGPDDSYLCHRVAQAWEMSKLLRGAAERGHLVLAVGDFNMIPLSLEHRIITAHSPVRDIWRVLHPDSSVGPADHPAEKARRRPIPTAEYNIRENGAASDGPYNTWRWSKQQQKLLGPGKPEVKVPPDTIDHRGKRLDYIFASSGDMPALNGGWVVSRVSVGMMMRHPQLGCSLSDHFAIEGTLTFHPLSTVAATQPPLSDSTNGVPPPTNARPSRPSKLSTPSARPDSETIVAGDIPFPHKFEHTHGQAHTAHTHVHVQHIHDISDISLSVDTDTDYKFDTRTMSTHIPATALQNGTFLHITSQSPTPSEDYTHSPTVSKKYDAQLLSNADAGDSTLALPSSVYDEILALTAKYVARERHQQLWRGRHFVISLVVLVACFVSVWFSPYNWVSFLLVLVSSLSLTAGAVDGLMALLFFKSELRALKEFEWEIRNTKAAMGGGIEPAQEEGDEW